MNNLLKAFRLQRVYDVQYGMLESDVIALLGRCYTKRKLSNSKRQLTWRAGYGVHDSKVVIITNYGRVVSIYTYYV